VGIISVEIKVGIAVVGINLVGIKVGITVVSIISVGIKVGIVGVGIVGSFFVGIVIFWSRDCSSRHCWPTPIQL
jgi:hypothetical protein